MSDLSNLNINEELLFEKYEEELDSQVQFDSHNYDSKDEYKQILRINDNIKIIKKILIKFKDGNSRMIILSKTIPIETN